MTAKQWTIMGIPGRDENGTDASWYVYNRETRESVKCDDRAEASRLVTELNMVAA